MKVFYKVLKKTADMSNIENLKKEKGGTPMGLAASQARFLQLTARLSDSEYEAQQISQERLKMTEKMNKYSEAYEAAVMNRQTVADVWDNNGQTRSKVALTWDVINGDPLNGGLGMKLVTAGGQIVVPNVEARDKIIAESEYVVVDNPTTPDGQETNQRVVPKYTESDFIILEEIKDPSILQKNLEEGNMFFATERDDETGSWDNKSISQVNGVTEEYDQTDDAVAKATYDKNMRKAERIDSMLEMRLSQLESEHQALKKEMESLEKLIDNDIEKDFKTFC